ncbi:MAG: DEAD/DEAH box helicase [Anaerolineales bacterium]|nr:DEAD/DEAH box helicase [Anaerolineales bacterium]MBX3004718.1 DEAD/DEAH box helicase [Anaerolineales bacterium]
MSFKSILDKYQKLAFSKRDKGDRFERLMQAYLLTDRTYADRFSKVWLWSEFPYRADLGGIDAGIDLVALTVEGEYWAIQCKFFDETTGIDKASVDTFLSTSSREFKDDNLLTRSFAHRLWISTTNKWSRNATEAIRNQKPPVSRLNLSDLSQAPVDWQKLDQGVHGELSRTAPKTLFKHQQTALEKAHEYYKTADRGKLIMACGTGKTLTSLRIAEHETKGQGTILFLVPSIALLGQTLRAWMADANQPINAIAICSDPKVTKQKGRNEDVDASSVIDLAFPASTDTKDILLQFQQIRDRKLPGMTVVFSTYHSIEVVSKAQKVLLRDGFGEFDLIICDEAHRTTGVKLADEDESAFVKVHDSKFIKATKRLYMTATPRLYSDDSKSRASQVAALLWSMDDAKVYGEEIYRIGFGEAVEKDLLTDYKVLILTVDNKDVPPAIWQMITDEKSEINADDASKLIGTINALSKQFLGDQGITKDADPEPMRRAVAFTQSIKISRKITNTYNDVTDVYLNALPADKKEEMVSIAAKHIDGTMAAPERDEMLAWLQETGDANECRILTNVRVLSEGVDVPSLDAVMFLSARNSQVDVVQSVGRVMRKSPGKKYGYIIIPVVVPPDVDAAQALDDNERYKVVWTVLNALRAHDDRFNATINKIDLNKTRPNQILVGRPETIFDQDDGRPHQISETTAEYQVGNVAHQLRMQFEELQSIVFARMVEKVGDRLYWEQWAKDVAKIAEQQIERIKFLITERKEQRSAFDAFLKGLQANINPSIDDAQAVEMLAQHMITQPIFEALFDNYSFVKNNAVSQSMQSMLDVLHGQAVAEESDSLQRFYESVKQRVAGIDNAEGKQQVIVELYEKFFKTAFPRMVEQLGIVYTPPEVVDFIVRSVQDVLKQEFGRSLSDENVHVLDPFTGTGTFVARLLQSGLIDKKDLARKYQYEIHANEIVLLAYYIAAVNIENVYHDLLGTEASYVPFEGIVLTDSFQLSEIAAGEGGVMDMSVFPRNSERVAKQKSTPIRVIVGNPPYSVGQRSANDNAQNQKYSNLDARIAETYAKATKATNKNSLYDSYIRAFRWASDRLDPEHGGVIAFVSNGSWLDSNSADGFRKTVETEFSSIWVFNLRGNQRTSGELSKKEGGKIFGAGSRAPVAVTLLVKNPKSQLDKASIHYHDIGDYLSREEKLNTIAKFGSVANPQIAWQEINPNEHGDWLRQRSGTFETFIPLSPEKKFSSSERSFFLTSSNGLQTNRDAWVYSSSSARVSQVMSDFIKKYQKFLKEAKGNQLVIGSEERTIKWSSSLVAKFEAGVQLKFDNQAIRESLYRPFFKQFVYRDDTLNHRPYQLPKLFPLSTSENLVIYVSGVGGNKDFSAIISNVIPDVQLLANGQCFPLFYYEEADKQSPTLFDSANSDYVRKDGISDFILKRAQSQYGKLVAKEDVFYYAYGLLHSPTYRSAFADDLKMQLPRLPLVDDVAAFWAFSRAGRQLADLHIDYEQVPPYDGAVVHQPEITKQGMPDGYYRVVKMRFPAKDKKDTIIYNKDIKITNIPAKAYEYVVNGKSAIEWVMERYQITTHKESGITNDPNDWAKEAGKPSYILDLLLSVINVSVQTVDIVNSLPDVKFE